MNLKEIQDLLKQINKLELAEFKMKTNDLELSVRTKHYEKNKTQNIISAPISTPAAPVQTPAAPAAPAAASDKPAAPEKVEEAAPDESNYLEVRSPIVGTFYRSPSPDKPPFFKVGDAVKQGDVVCIVEAMKLFNEIESEVSGKVVKVMVEDAQPVEYDQVLFLVDPKG
ncbi:MAG TPA: acetyl-CoA carboxylase biotin carboxyl carrier protein [Saprospiraceae bacterium]|nr:acetyl-CoA carboxylase biotin carboxyl carrier protein [Saprospiraceae bacterium]